METKPVMSMEDRWLAKSGLFAQSRFRRLFKARHQEINKMEIRTNSYSVALLDNPLPFTMYRLQIRSKVRCGDRGDWLLEKRYSEFANFRKQLLKMIQKWENAFDWDNSYEKIEFILVSNSLRKPLTHDFPRKHLRADTNAIISKRRGKLQEFVRRLLATYADMSVYMHNMLTEETMRGFSQLQTIFQELENFLDIPDSQKDVERRQVAAILALEDVDDPLDHDDDDEAADTPTRTCCICLNDIALEDELDSKTDTNNGSLGTMKMVQLPCSHHFHEDCVLDWFNTNMNCPLCRQDSTTLAFAVTVQ